MKLQLSSRLARVAATVTATATATLLAAACSSSSSTGSGGSPSGGGSAIFVAAVRYTSCMRSHGVPEYPDPNSGGQLPKITPSNESQLGVTESRFTSAQAACQHLWPYQAPTQAEQRQDLADAVKFARCMRSHGLPKFPDPITDPNSGRVEFVLSSSRDGFNPHSPQTLAKVRVCEHGLPADLLQGNPAGVEVTITP